MSDWPLRNLVLTGYAVPHALGYIPLASGTPNPQPLHPLELLDRADQLGLGGIEIPLAAKVPSFEGRVVDLPPVGDEIVAQLNSRGLRLIADFGILADHTGSEIVDYLRLAHRLGARLVRAVISNLLCGDRRPVAEGWPERLSRTASRLRQALPVAEELGMCLAIENHQDASTDDMWWLAEAVSHSPAFGVTLDTGNPLATGEDPVEACRKLAPLIRHLHLKDYTIHFAPNGYRLVRCAAGEGVVDFPAILELVRAHGHEVIPGIEIAAHSARTIPWLEAGWWSTYGPRDARQLLPVLKLLWERGLPAERPYATVWELGGETAAVVADEWRLVESSVGYFRSLAATAK